MPTWVKPELPSGFSSSLYWVAPDTSAQLKVNCLMPTSTVTLGAAGAAGGGKFAVDGELLLPPQADSRSTTIGKIILFIDSPTCDSYMPIIEHLTAVDSRRLTSASGRKRTFDFMDFGASERPLWRKADIKPETPEIESENVRFTLGSGHSGNIGQRVR